MDLQVELPLVVLLEQILEAGMASELVLEASWVLEISGMDWTGYCQNRIWIDLAVKLEDWASLEDWLEQAG